MIIKVNRIILLFMALLCYQDLIAGSSRYRPELRGRNSWGYFRPIWIRPHPSTQVLATLVSDPKGRIEREFRVPERLKDRVRFWMSVYGIYGNRMRLVHDRDQAGLVYGYIDLSPLYQRYPVAKATALALTIEQEIVGELGKRIEAIGYEDRVPSSLLKSQRSLKYLLMAQGYKRSTLFQAVTRIRTQSGQKDSFVKALDRSRSLRLFIKEMMRKERLPLALVSIPFVESSYNPKAESKAGARGIWQFLPETAVEFSSVNDAERFMADPHFQTVAAIRWFKRYRKELPDWGTTITSYHSGVTKVRQMVQQYGHDGIESLINKSNEGEGLGFAGNNYYCEVLAANIIQAYRREVF